MAVYTIYLPSFPHETSHRVLPRSAASASVDAAATQATLADAAFVPECFSRAAFFLGPLWLAWHRLWLALVVWLVAFSLLTDLGARYVGWGAAVGIGVLLQALLGLEGNNLRRGELVRRGYRLVDVAVGTKLDDAERSFYQRRFETQPASPPAPGGTTPSPPFKPISHPEVIGLFPLPEDHR